MWWQCSKSSLIFFTKSRVHKRNVLISRVIYVFILNIHSKTCSASWQKYEKLFIHEYMSMCMYCTRAEIHVCVWIWMRCSRFKNSDFAIRLTWLHHSRQCVSVPIASRSRQISHEILCGVQRQINSAAYGIPQYSGSHSGTVSANYIKCANVFPQSLERNIPVAELAKGKGGWIKL